MTLDKKLMEVKKITFFSGSSRKLGYYSLATFGPTSKRFALGWWPPWKTKWVSVTVGSPCYPRTRRSLWSPQVQRFPSLRVSGGCPWRSTSCLPMWMKQANYPIKLEIYDLFFLKKIQEQDLSFSVYRRPEFHSDELSKAAVFQGGEYAFGRSGRGALFPAIQAMKMLEFFLLSLIETFVCETA